LSVLYLLAKVAWDDFCAPCTPGQE